jgi:endonuclease YncB( thermonuclease family)
MRAAVIFLIVSVVLGALVFFALEYLGLIKPPGKPIVGFASIIDGDTFEIDNIRIRLMGIDAPESGQLCHDDAGKTYPCGQKAALALGEHVSTGTLACVPFDRDRYNAFLAVCHLGAEDIAVWLVENGLAVTYPDDDSSEYAAAQDRAMAARKGVWAGAFDLPWEWREGR